MSKVEVNQISSQCGSTLTIGQSGDTVQLASGATQTGFGRTGTVDWDTTAKTASFTAVSGDGYFVNTTSGAITVTLPASPSAGDIVSVRDYAQTFQTNNCTIGRNSQPIDGQTFDLILSTKGIAVTLVYVDGTQGWKSVNSNEIVNEELYVSATGGTVTTSGDYKIHTFTGPGCFTVSCAGNPAGSSTVDYLVIAGGGSGGSAGSNSGRTAGGGGAGGYRESGGSASGCYSIGLPANSCVAALPVSAQVYPITVGAGGAVRNTNVSGGAGSNSVFSTITSTGGAGGQSGNGEDGGSGGGAGASTSGCTGGSGNTPPVTPSQGNDGGDGAVPQLAGGGGGASSAGTPGNPSPTNPIRGQGGSGATSCITASPVTRAGGGGGANTNNPANGGPGGGGNAPTSASGGTGNAGQVNTGSGGGGGPRSAPEANGGAGGSGIVIIRYKFQ